MHTNELVAGRKLDALVAEKVMRFRRVVDQSGTVGYAFSRHPPVRYLRMDEEWDGVGIMTYLPPFSTDLSAAWQIVELAGQQWLIGRVWQDLVNVGGWGVFTENEDDNSLVCIAEGETAPLAICRAALAAVE